MISHSRLPAQVAGFLREITLAFLGKGEYNWLKNPLPTDKR